MAFEKSEQKLNIAIESIFKLSTGALLEVYYWALILRLFGFFRLVGYS